jgi:hypothetical protein
LAGIFIGDMRLVTSRQGNRGSAGIESHNSRVRRHYTISKKDFSTVEAAGINFLKNFSGKNNPSVGELVFA